MALYFLSYDLRNEKGNDGYKKLYKELATFKAVRILESLWSFEKDNTNCEKLRDHFKKFIDKDDGLIVIEEKDWAATRLDGKPQNAE